MFYNGLGKELSQKEWRDHHRLARSAGQPDAKSRMVDSILFEKENDFCMTFGSAYGRPTLRQLANSAKDLSDFYYSFDFYITRAIVLYNLAQKKCPFELKNSLFNKNVRGMARCYGFIQIIPIDYTVFLW